MNTVPHAPSPRGTPSGLEYAAMLVSAVQDSLSLRDFLAVAAAAVLIYTAAEDAATGPLARPAPDIALEKTDPVLAEVGATAIRLSDARAQAVLSGGGAAEVMAPAALFANGLVEEAADQVALAKAAEEAGLADALEIRAQLALARRRILSSAYLDLAVRRSVTDEAIRAAYAADVVQAKMDQRLDLQRILVATEGEAQELRQQIAQGTAFTRLAMAHSLDEQTRLQAGHIADLPRGTLPDALGTAIDQLPLGVVSDPIKGPNGWYLVRVEARSAVFMPPYEEMAPLISERLRAQVVATAVLEARSAVPIRTAAMGPMAATTAAASAGSLAVSW